MLKRTLLISIIMLLITNVIAQSETTGLKRGERPPINYERISPDAYKTGVLLIKFHADAEKYLTKSSFDSNTDGHIEFGNKNIDVLNKSFGVSKATAHFNHPAFTGKYADRHKDWGFHLWYRLELDSKTDIPLAIRQFSQLKEIEIAEPEFKKQIIGSHNDEDFIRIEATIDTQNETWTPNDPMYNAQWHYHNTGQQNGTAGSDIDLERAWEIEKGNPEVIVAIIDGGIDYNHLDLAGNMWEDIGYNFVNNSPSVSAHNHGTHVAGTVAALSNNLVGVAGIAGGSGFADGVRLMSCQVFTANSSGGFHLAPVYAADNGAAISQNSWGYTSPGVFEQSTLDAIDYFNANGGGEAMSGGITIFAAGNSYSDGEWYPGYYEGAMSVASTNNQDAIAWYSNFGNWIDISAPGGETNTLTQRGVLSTLNNNEYGFYQGTSMACPHVSGVAALILSKVYGSLSPEDLFDILVLSTDNHYAVNPEFSGKLGSGRLNAYSALTVAEIIQYLPDNPTNLQSFSISESQIDLSWELNEDENPVMLVYSDLGAFGMPQEGQSYSVGETLEGGGQVLYIGSSTHFEHTNLDAASLYHYKLFSMSTSEPVMYSLGRSAFEHTQCGLFELPLLESFDQSTFPYCWGFAPSQGNWEIDGSRGNPAPSAKFHWSPQQENYSFSLESPPLNGNIAGNAIALEFDLLLDNYSTQTLELMVVQVFDGQNWHNVAVFDNAEGDMAWETHTVDITPFALHNHFKVRFNATGQNSYNINHWLIDNFKVFSFSCPQPWDFQVVDLNTHEVSLNWEQAGDEENWEITYGVPGFDPLQEGQLISEITQTNYTLTGLEVFTSYEVYVRADCSDDDYSLWNGPHSFTTLASCPAPTQLEASLITDVEAFISWETYNSDNTWVLAFGELGFNPESQGTIIENITENEYLLENLNGTTSYHVYIYEVCDTNDLSIWEGPIEFTTSCAIYQLPFTEEFANSSTECWTYPEGQSNWKISSDYTPPSSDSGAPHAVFSWNPSATNYSHSITSPIFNASSQAENIVIDFIVFLNNFNENSLEQLSLEYKALDEKTWQLLENFTNQGVGSGTQEFVKVGLELDNMNEKLFQIRFRAHGQNSYSINGWSVDDISLYFKEVPCPMASGINIANLGATFAEIAWAEHEDVFTWSLLYGEKNTDLESEGILIEDIEQNSVLLENLQANTEYAFLLKSHCIEENSEWSQERSFTTEIMQFTVDITIEPEEAGQVTGQGTYNAGESIELTAEPANEDIVFLQWKHNNEMVSEDATYTFVLESDMSFVAVFETATSTEQLMASQEINIFPNPTSQILNIETGEWALDYINILSMQGQLVRRIDVSKEKQSTISISLKNLHPGLYFIEFDNTGIIKRLIIKK